MRVTLRIDATPEQADALVKEWLRDPSGTIRIQTANADMQVPLTYVKEG
jgi:hypothetical protein